MKRRRLSILAAVAMLATLLPASAAPAAAAGPAVFINEIHYDNSGADTGEAIEIAGPAGTNLDGWSIALYNGSATQLNVYGTINLTGIIPNQQAGFGTLNFARSGIQNGSPDGLALVDAGSTVVQFLSYEGSFSVATGPAAGMTSIDIGVEEGSGTPVGDSLQLTGTGTQGGDFTWAASQPNTFGAVNTGQTFVGGGGPTVLINEVDSDTPGTDSAEFVELYDGGAGNTDLTGLSLVLYNGSDDASYDAFDLDGQVTDGDGYFLLCGDAANTANCDLDVSPNTNLIQNGADAVALVQGDAIDFPNDTPVTTANVLDALVYDTNDGDDAGLLVLLNAAQPQVNEDGSGDKDNHSNQRCPNGSGGARNTGTYDQYAPTPGAENTCEDPVVITDLFIHEIQGSGLSVTAPGTIVRVRGVVVGDYQGGSELDGFFLQEEDVDTDGNADTSEGIFVYCEPCLVEVVEGNIVEVVGVQEDFFDMSQIDVGAAGPDGVVTVIDSGDNSGLVTAASVDLPAPASTTDEATFENVEGMLVTFVDELTATEYFQLGRFGQIVVSENGRLRQFTNDNLPSVSGFTDHLAEVSKRRIILDDINNFQNIDPVYHPQPNGFAVDNFIRGGDTITDLTGVMHWSWAGSGGTDAWRIRPQVDTPVQFYRANPRDLSPEDVGGDVKVATLNVLNYFTTIDEGDKECGPIPGEDCRGAHSEVERIRQLDKLVAALSGIDADVVGLVEIENNPSASLESITTALNSATGDSYDYVDAGYVGNDVIKVGLIYNTDTVTASGNYAILDTPDFIDPNNTGADRNRAALAETFTENASGGSFTAVVNHFKSKGTPCGAGDDDATTGQGNCAVTRDLAAAELVDWLATDPTGSGDSDLIVIGDLNAYAMEDAIATLKKGADNAANTRDDYTDLVDLFIGAANSYSFVFSGEWGYLDHALATESLVGQVTGVTHWHINADEVNLLDYNDTVQDDNEAFFEAKPATNELYADDAFRSSDHDPVIVGLELTVTPAQAKEHALSVLNGLLPTGNKQDDKPIEKAIESIEGSLNPDYWVDDFHLTDKGNKVFDEEKKAVKDLMKVKGAAKDDAAGVIEMLVAADRLLAATAIADAAAAGVDATKAKKALADGDAESKPDKAINDYKKAWREATKALGKVEVRFATFNASLNRFDAGDLISDLSTSGDAQAQTIAEIIQRNRPEVLLVNEFDYDAGGAAAGQFQDNYLAVSQNGAEPIVYPYRYVAPSNTGVDSGFDLDNNAVLGEPNDAFGFGFFEGQYAFVVYSMYPIAENDIRTFQDFLWKDMPGAILPEYPDETPWYSPEELEVVRLSSKNHVDVPIVIGDRTVHFLVSHPTPPVFDGDEDRNGKRNYDEIRFWADYVKGGGTASYIYDDNGNYGGLANNALFVIAGDQNSDPNDGDSIPGAIQQLLDSPKVNTKVTPSSLGGPEQAADQGGANETHLSDPAFDTADFAEPPGNLRVDYVLPRKNMKITNAGVFWPQSTDPLFALVGTFPFPSSDHRLVWIDVDL